MFGCEGNKVVQGVSDMPKITDKEKINSTSGHLTKKETETQEVYNDIHWNGNRGLQVDCSYLSEKFSKVRIEQKPDLYDMLSCDSILYVNKSEFEKCNSNDCRLLSVVFDDSITEVSIGNETISRNTTINELKQMFKACNTLYERKIYGDTTQYKTCLIMSKYQDLGLDVFAKKDKIIQIDIYEPS